MAWFDRVASGAAKASGSARAFLAAVLVVVGWAAAGPFFGWSDGHQLAINTVTTVVTFLMVFLLQHAQERDTRAMQAKLDALVISQPGAPNELAGLEQREDCDPSDSSQDDASTPSGPPRS